jgi:hypothetical protein
MRLEPATSAVTGQLSNQTELRTTTRQRLEMPRQMHSG